MADQNVYRVRQGEYRVVYTVAADVLVIEVVKAANRRDVYDRR